MRAAIILSVCIAIVLTWVAVSTSDYYEAIQRHDLCQQMVKAGAWPKITCKEN